MSKITDGLVTFTASGALTQKQRVKVTGSSTTIPIEVEVAGAGEQSIGNVERAAADGAFVVVRLQNWGGTLEGMSAGAITSGATLYGAAAGQIDDASSGSAIGVALTSASGADEMIEYAPFAVLSTTAATVSFADVAAATAAATVEAALAELYADILTTQALIPLPLGNFKESTNFDVANIAANGGVLASDTTPILSAINDATDGCQVLTWANTNNDQVVIQAIIPPDIDVTADIVLHCRIASEATTDAVGFTVDWFINEGDTKVVDTTTTNQTATWAEKVAVLGNADIGAGSQTITIGLTPVAHTTDNMLMSACWLEYTRVMLTS